MLDPSLWQDSDPGGAIVLSTICNCPTGHEVPKPLDSCSHTIRSRRHVTFPKYSPIIDPLDSYLDARRHMIARTAR